MQKKHLLNNKLSVENIKKYYNNKQVLSDVSLYINQGEIVGLFGPNGAGKTTLFGIMIGFIKMNSGKIFFNKEDISSFQTHMIAKLGISYLPQESSTFRDLSVEDNIRIILEIVHKDNSQITEFVNLLMQEFSISHLRKKKAFTLSGGERRRLEIARALAVNPKFIMLDEPLAGIDPLMIDDIKVLTQKLKDRGIGILITDHNVRETLSIVDRAYVIYEGKVLASGTSSAITTNKKVKQVYLGSTY